MHQIDAKLSRGSHNADGQGDRERPEADRCANKEPLRGNKCIRHKYDSRYNRLAVMYTVYMEGLLVDTNLARFEIYSYNT